VKSQYRDPMDLQYVIETIPALVLCTLPNGTVEYVNRAWREYTGYSPKQLTDSGWRSIVHTDDLAKFLHEWNMAMSAGRPFETEARIRRSDGQYHWFLIKKALAVSGTRNGQPSLRTMIAFEDISDRKQAEEERERLRQVQAELARVSRASTLGELAASLAHEIKQPIGAAVTNAEACLRFIDRPEPDLAEALEAASKMIRDARRAAEIIDRVRSLYQNGSSQLELIDLNHVIDEMVTMMKDEATRHGVAIHTSLAREIPYVMADRVQLQQALMNLLLNGIEATPHSKGGELTVKSQLAPDGQLLVSISDTGIGIPPENFERIFDAFFTTKAQGTGLGLPITRSIIQSHGGRIWATANSGPGSTFVFVLPQTTTAQA